MYKQIIMLLISVFIFNSSMANTQLKEQTIMNMYSKSEYDAYGNWRKDALQDTEIIFMYGGLKLNTALLHYQKKYNAKNYAEDASCIEIYPSLYINEARDDFVKVKLAKLKTLQNGNVRVIIEAYPSDKNKKKEYLHDFSLSCTDNKCHVTDILQNGNYSLIEVINDLCT